jgi:hypothetical protein
MMRSSSCLDLVYPIFLMSSLSSFERWVAKDAIYIFTIFDEKFVISAIYASFVLGASEWAWG